MSKTRFIKVVGDNPKMRVLEFLIEGRELDYSISDIAEGAEIGRTTLFRIWKDLENLKIVKHTRNIGNAKLYKLDTENPIVKKFIDLFDLVVIEPLKQESKIIMKSQLFSSN